MTVAAVLAGSRNFHVENCDVLDGLRALPAGCVNAVVTSPPYYALRSYLAADHPDKHKEHGSEPTPEAFIATMVEVFREVKRVLRDDGVLWLNLGDSYNAGTRASRKPSKDCDVGYWQAGGTMGDFRCKVDGLKIGDKLNMPHRVAAALQADGWYWRDTVIWSKRSPMPESVSGWQWVRCKIKIGKSARAPAGKRAAAAAVPQGETLGRAGGEGRIDVDAKFKPCPGCDKCRDHDGWVLRRGRWRCTQAHEYIFQFTKSDVYFCDGDVAKVKAVGDSPGNKNAGKYGDDGAGADLNRKSEQKSSMDAVERANPRNVLTLSNEPTKAKHFAPFPTELVRFCLLPSLAKDYCAACGEPYAPMVERERKATRPGKNNKIWKHADSGDPVQQRTHTSPNLDPERHVLCTKTVGHKRTCNCETTATKGGLVLDPYAGTATVGVVALKLGARFLGFELNPEYIPIGYSRIENKLPLFA